MKKTLKRLRPKTPPPADRVTKSATDANAPSKQLVQKPPPEQKVLSGPMPVVPKGWKWKGKREKFQTQSYLLVEPKDMPEGFIRLHKNCVPDSYFRVDPKTNVVDCMMTMLPQTKGMTQVRVSWAECVGCQNYFLRCICKPGLIHPRSVEWVYIRALMRQDDHPDAKDSIIDSTGMAVTERAVHWYKGKESKDQGSFYLPDRPVRTVGATPTRRTLAKPSDRPGSVRKTLRRANKSVRSTAPDDFTFDLSKTNADAADAADVLTEQVVAALNKKPVRKTLKKKGVR